MKKRVKSNIITLVIIIAIIIFSFIILNTNNKAEISKETAKCIGDKSTLYVQLGCPHCEDQKEMFGENLQHINVIDCYYEKEKCISQNISMIPTWDISDKYYVGVQSIDKLKTLTGC
jgi:glutaredoxin